MALYSNESKNRVPPFGITEEERNRHAAKVPGTVIVRPVVANTPEGSRGAAQVLGQLTASVLSGVNLSASASNSSDLNVNLSGEI